MNNSREIPPPQTTVPTSVHAGKVKLAIRDIRQGLQNWHLWAVMGWQDILQRYRRSVLGPFWITVSMGILVVSLGVIYAKLFNVPINDYLPFLTLGLLAWGVIASIVNEGCQVFTSSENFIRQIHVPLSTFVFRLMWRNLIVFGHNLVIYIPVALYFNIWPGIAGLLIFPGMLLAMINLVWMVVLVGLLCTRFRDVTQIVASMLQVIFFISPVIWKPAAMAGHPRVVDWNPFFHLIELIRAPLLGQVALTSNWMFSISLFLTGVPLTLLIYSRYRSQVAYWL